MNMPEVDAYGTVQPHTVIRQHLDYGHWYERTQGTRAGWGTGRGRWPSCQAAGLSVQ